MSDQSTLVIESLGEKHNRGDFWGARHYFQRQASQDTKRSIARIFVIRPEIDKEAVLGYYTLSALSIELSALQNKLSRKLPEHAIPAALIGRLAVSSEFQGTGIGKILLIDVIIRTPAISDEIAFYAMGVGAVSADAEAFYKI